MRDLPSSIPTKSKYKELIASDLFKNMEDYSNIFLQKNQIYLSDYADKWVEDPLHQWSRQWEYPYVYQKVIDHVSEGNDNHILDAGSGVTFFPYYLKSNLPNTNIICCDLDSTLEKTFDQINLSNNQTINFLHLDLENLSLETGIFDIIYCISVIEHTKNYSKIIDEFYRLLKLNGKLIITFDISLDGTGEISPMKAEELLRYIFSKFNIKNGDMDVHSRLFSDEIITTEYINSINPKLLPPGRNSILRKIIKSIVRRQPMKTKLPNLSFFCLQVIKKIE